jgi:hypothetical protein
MGEQAPRETGHFLCEGGSVIEMDLPVSEAIAERITKGMIRRVNADGSPYVPPAPEGEGEGNDPPSGPDGAQPPAPATQGGSDLTNGVPPRPAQSAPKAEWVGYAVLVGGMPVDDAEALTKQDLIDLYGKD